MAHVRHNSGRVEWYTPVHIIEAARAVMGGIDLDPASSEAANRIVRAEHFYSRADNGLRPDRPWWGRIWLGPPFGQPHITRFAERAVLEVESGAVQQLLWLSNNATETAWAQLLLSAAQTACFLAARLSFLNETLRPVGSPLQGQMVLALGAVDIDLFKAEFGVWGACFVNSRLSLRPHRQFSLWQGADADRAGVGGPYVGGTGMQSGGRPLPDSIAGATGGRKTRSD